MQKAECKRQNEDGNSTESEVLSPEQENYLALRTQHSVRFFVFVLHSAL